MKYTPFLDVHKSMNPLDKAKIKLLYLYIYRNIDLHTRVYSYFKMQTNFK